MLTRTPIESHLNVDDLLEQLTLEEKAALTAGKDFWHTTAIPRLNIPSIRLSDGPNGVRGTRFFGGVPAACLPCGTAIGATFNADLLVKVGNLLGDEARAKGAHVLLGPTINIQRSPIGGRGFESYSEDPFLSGVLAGFYCRGVQEKGIVPTLKHFVCNDQEHERMAVNAIVSERALREIYLLPFMVAIKLSQPGAIMTAYNKVNGIHAAENQHILKDILREEWKWKGLLMSDWFGTYSTSEAISAGLDLEMPGTSRWRGAALVHAVASNKVKISKLNERVRAVLDLINLTTKSNISENASESSLDRAEDRQLIRNVGAESIVLLKNVENILPLKKSKRVAVIGPNSKIAAISGGGSASLNPYYAVTPYDGIKAKASSGIDFAQGIYGHLSLPALGKRLRTPGGSIGFSLKVYNESPECGERRLLEERLLTESNMFFIDYNHPELLPVWYADAEGFFTPEETGIYDFGVCVQGTARMYIDGELIVSNFENQKTGSSFLGAGTIEELGHKRMIAGTQYKILVQWGCAKTSKLKNPGVLDFGHGGLSFGGCRRLDHEESISEAVDLAKRTDQVVIIAGLSAEWETEGQDRETMELPPRTNELITRVLQVNPNTVVVIQSGTPVLMPWIDQAKAVVHAWYGGNETGNAIADVLYGDVNPSGKLPITIPHRFEDSPSYLNYRSEGGRTLYGEDVYVGYRYYDKVKKTPLFPFGYGLSYTSFKFAEMKIRNESYNKLRISVQVSNTGLVGGAEVVQLYISPVSPPINRPPKELKAFTKVFVQSAAVETVELDLDIIRATSYWDEDHEKWCSAAGLYKILVGNSSDAKFLEAELLVETTSYWLGL